MGVISFTNIIAPLLLHSCFYLFFCSASDTITGSQFIRDPETITSNGGVYKLGFFSPNGSSHRYVGIWSDVSVLNVIWVANRDVPLNDSSGVVKISEDGNLVVLNGQNKSIWSSNVSSSASTNASAQISDAGNLVLRGHKKGTILWESFGNPCDSFLAKMKISTNTRTGEKTLLKSWKSPSDPSIGSFSAGMDPLNIPEIFIWNNNGQPYWRSGPWNSQVFIGIPSMNSVYLDGFTVLTDEDGTTSLTFSFVEFNFSSFVLNSQGTLEQKEWDSGKENWGIFWSSKETECDVYGKCGAFGSCNAKETPICRCLSGFKPKNLEEWSKQNWTSGCVRRKLLQCERKDSGKDDGFLQLKMMKVPDFAEWSSSTLEDNCKSQCLQNCSCVAYAFDAGIGCMSWSGDLIDIQEFSKDGDGADLYIRIAYSELDKKQNMRVIISTAVLVGTITITICTYFAWTLKRAKKKISKEVLLFNRGDAYPNLLSDSEMLGENMSGGKFKDLPVFNFAKLAASTNNFDIANKLGQGGFGPVYKGKLLDGREIAVKRLSRASGQGLEEFMNEVVVISKLQHRNLVKLLGCCVEGEEKMLIYEFMPNKSLDSFLFDPMKREVLHWGKRFEIIEGIGRGLLYLHRDSRLKIIHRDLKASNILLDEELNPKISDFGMARIFGNNQDQANTKRVVGTYGYMSPEYAMEGRFSQKSDVFSFGVLHLEIISGRRNTSFYNDDQSQSLLGFAWELWNKDNIIALTDPAMADESIRIEVLRCIHVGLLCVQELAKDRPTMSTVLSMLSSEIVDLPTPKQPAFTGRQSGSDTGCSRPNQNQCSINNLTVTIVDGR